MELWMNLLFGNPIGLLSMIVLFATLGVFIFIIRMYIVKSAEKPQGKVGTKYTEIDLDSKL